MTSKRMNRPRRNAGKLVVLFLCGVLIHTLANAAVRTGTVISGSGSGKRTTVGMGTLAPRGPQPKPLRGTTTAYFTGWGTLVEKGTATLTMSVTIDQARRIQRIIIPNRDPKAVKMDPGDHVKKLAETLKIGDAVKFDFLITGNRVYGTNISLYKALSTGPGAAPFTFIRSKLIPAGKQKIMTVTATAGVNPCTFRVPEEVDDKGRSVPQRKVADQLKKFCRSDLLDLEYKTVNYHFVLTGVKAARKSDQGRVLKIDKTKIKGYEHMVVSIKTDRRTLRLIDPEPIIELKLKNVANPAPDPQVQTALKTIKPDDYVMFKYRRQRSVYWLDEIYPSSQSGPNPSSTHNGTE